MGRSIPALRFTLGHQRRAPEVTTAAAARAAVAPVAAEAAETAAVARWAEVVKVGEVEVATAQVGWVLAAVAATALAMMVVATTVEAAMGEAQVAAAETAAAVATALGSAVREAHHSRIRRAQPAIAMRMRHACAFACCLADTRAGATHWDDSKQLEALLWEAETASGLSDDLGYDLGQTSCCGLSRHRQGLAGLAHRRSIQIAIRVCSRRHSLRCASSRSV